MTDHPMQCYPGQFEPWRRGELAPMKKALGWQISYDGQERSCVPTQAIINIADHAISRAMSGQITSSTGDKP